MKEPRRCGALSFSGSWVQTAFEERGRGQAACLAPFLLRNEGRRHLITAHGRSPRGRSRSGAGHIGLLRLASRGCGEPAHQRGCHIQGMLDVGFALGDISGPALRHECRKNAAGDAKFYVGRHWISEALIVKVFTSKHFIQDWQGTESALVHRSGSCLPMPRQRGGSRA